MITQTLEDAVQVPVLTVVVNVVIIGSLQSEIQSDMLKN